MSRSGGVVRETLLVLPSVMQAGVGVFGGAVSALRGLVLAAALVPVVTVVVSTIEIGRLARATPDGARSS
ncbi:MAG TPA: hypothetical protein VID28_23740 [Methylomirabilota bacterium]